MNAEELKALIAARSTKGYFPAPFDLAVKRHKKYSGFVDWGKTPIEMVSPRNVLFVHGRFSQDRLAYRADNMECLLDGSCPPYVLTDETGSYLLDGNHRMLIARLLGLEEVPCRVARVIP